MTPAERAAMVCEAWNVRSDVLRAHIELEIESAVVDARTEMRDRAAVVAHEYAEASIAMSPPLSPAFLAATTIEDGIRALPVRP